jgi:hypothetical protein
MRALFSLVVISLLVMGCSPAYLSGHDLRSSPSRYITRLVKIDSSTVDFDSDRGWYDSSRAMVEGFDELRVHRAVPADSVSSAELPRSGYWEFLTTVISMAALYAFFFLFLLRGYST